MQIGVVGLGKMGGSYVQNLVRNGYQVVGFDVNPKMGQWPELEGYQRMDSLEEMVFDQPAIYFFFLPAGQITQEAIGKVMKEAVQDSIIIDCSNAPFANSIQLHAACRDMGILYYDCGISGGMKGALEGACMMMGGSVEPIAEVKAILEATCVEKGFLYTNQPGAGHYLKMIHNGIEYGMMQAIAEGLGLLDKQERFDYDLSQVTQVWNHGSIIESFLMGCIQKQIAKDATLIDFQGPVHASGEGKWTLEESLQWNVPLPTIGLSLMMRNASMDQTPYANKVLSAMRFGFGGHQENRCSN